MSTLGLDCMVNVGAFQRFINSSGKERVAVVLSSRLFDQILVVMVVVVDA